MELKTTPQNLKNLIEAGALISTKPLFDPLVLTCQPTQILNKQNHGNIIAVYNTYQPSFFESYSPEPTGSMAPIPSHLILSRLKNDFGSDTVTLSTDKKTVNLDDGVNHYDTGLEDTDELLFPTQMKKTEYGWLPEKWDPDFSTIIDAKLLQLPDATTYTFEYKAKKFTVSAPKDGNFTRKLDTKKLLESKPFKKLVDPEYINVVSKVLKGDVLLGFSGNLILLASITKDNQGGELCTQTYLIASMTERED